MKKLLGSFFGTIFLFQKQECDVIISYLNKTMQVLVKNQNDVIVDQYLNMNQNQVANSLSIIKNNYSEFLEKMMKDKKLTIKDVICRHDVSPEFYGILLQKMIHLESFGSEIVFTYHGKTFFISAKDHRNKVILSGSFKNETLKITEAIKKINRVIDRYKNITS